MVHYVEENTSQEINSSSVGEWIPRIVSNPKIHYSVYKCLPIVPILSKTNRGCAIPSHFLKTHFNIIITIISTSSYSKRSSSFSLSNKTPLSRPCCRLANSILLVLINLMFGKDYSIWSSLACHLKFLE